MSAARTGRAVGARLMTMCAAVLYEVKRLYKCKRRAVPDSLRKRRGAVMPGWNFETSPLMLVSAALGRVAGQGFYGVAQAAFYRFEALLYSAAASGEGYG